MNELVVHFHLVKRHRSEAVEQNEVEVSDSKLFGKVLAGEALLLIDSQEPGDVRSSISFVIRGVSSL